MPRLLSCICGNAVEFPEGQSDFSCEKCGRTYNYQGHYLGAAAGSPAESDQRANDQDAAIEQAFEAGTLPEEDRRNAPTFDEIIPPAPAKPAKKKK